MTRQKDRKSNQTSRRRGEEEKGNKNQNDSPEIADKGDDTRHPRSSFGAMEHEATVRSSFRPQWNGEIKVPLTENPELWKGLESEHAANLQ